MISIVFKDNIVYIARNKEIEEQILVKDNKNKIINLLNNNIILIYNCSQFWEYIEKEITSKLPVENIIDLRILQKLLLGGTKKLKEININNAKSLFYLKEELDQSINNIKDSLNIDLYEAHKIWIKHSYCGYKLESNKIYWNEDKAKEIEDWCITTQTRCIRNIIKSSFTKEYIKDIIYDQYLDILMSEEGANILMEKGYTPVRKSKNFINVTCNNIVEENELKRLGALCEKNKKGKSIYKINIEQFKILSEEYNRENPEEFNSYYDQIMNDILRGKNELEKYNKLINLNSTSKEFKVFVSNILISKEIKIARMFLGLINIVNDPVFCIDSYKDFYIGVNNVNNYKKELKKYIDMEQFKLAYPNISYYDTNDSRFLEIIYKINKLELSLNDKFNLFKKINIDISSIKSKKIKEVIINSSQDELNSLDADIINEIYNAYLITNIDIENPNTWNERFFWLFNYKLYKKMNKLKTTYLDGKLGRKSTIEINNECYLETKFNVNEAITGRWTSGFHNIPSGECIKSIFTSRFNGGCIAMPDGSQMEIRALARVSGDENLFKAFNSGLDIHKFFASKIYKIPYEKVTSRQRSLSKSAVFGLVYGISEYSFAEAYTNGNLQEAKEIYNSMYESFPKIKDYIDKAHEECKKYNKVTTLTNRFINLEGGKRAILRESQNYKIQGYASDLSGLIMYEIQKYIDEHNMKSKLICTVHDSIEIDLHPDEVFELVDVIYKAFNEYPIEEFGTPVACDVPLSVNMGSECKISKFIHDKDYNEIIIELNGYIKDIEDLVNNWKNVYSTVEYITENIYKKNDIKEYQPWEDMMNNGKSTITKYVGQNLIKGKRKIHIIRNK